MSKAQAKAAILIQRDLSAILRPGQILRPKPKATDPLCLENHDPSTTDPSSDKNLFGSKVSALGYSFSSREIDLEVHNSETYQG